MPYPQTQAPQCQGAQPVLSSIAAPTGTTSTSFVCLGLGAAGAVITPLASGRIKVDITGVVLNSTIADGCSVQVIFGTGTAPANGAAVPGSAVTVGSIKPFVASTAAGQQGVSVSVVVSGLVLGTAYWFDLQFEAVTGGTATLKGVDTVLTEV